MIFSATIVKAGATAGTWIISPAYTRVDGQPAPNITALAANGLSFADGDIVLCAESINPFDHSSVRSFDNNNGACPVIIATFMQLLTTLCDMIVRGKMTLGQGTKKMVLGDDLQTWAQAKDAEIAALYTWAKTGTGANGSIPAFPGTPAETSWNANTLSANHKLD